MSKTTNRQTQKVVSTGRRLVTNAANDDNVEIFDRPVNLNTIVQSISEDEKRDEKRVMQWLEATEATLEYSKGLPFERSTTETFRKAIAQPTAIQFFDSLGKVVSLVRQYARARFVAAATEYSKLSSNRTTDGRSLRNGGPSPGEDGSTRSRRPRDNTRDSSESSVSEEPRITQQMTTVGAGRRARTIPANPLTELAPMPLTFELMQNAYDRLTRGGTQKRPVDEVLIDMITLMFYETAPRGERGAFKSDFVSDFFTETSLSTRVLQLLTESEREELFYDLIVITQLANLSDASFPVKPLGSNGLDPREAYDFGRRNFIQCSFIIDQLLRTYKKESIISERLAVRSLARTIAVAATEPVTVDGWSVKRPLLMIDFAFINRVRWRPSEFVPFILFCWENTLHRYQPPEAFKGQFDRKARTGKIIIHRRISFDNLVRGIVAVPGRKKKDQIVDASSQEASSGEMEPSSSASSSGQGSSRSESDFADSKSSDDVPVNASSSASREDDDDEDEGVSDEMSSPPGTRQRQRTSRYPTRNRQSNPMAFETAMYLMSQPIGGLVYTMDPLDIIQRSGEDSRQVLKFSTEQQNFMDLVRSYEVRSSSFETKGDTERAYGARAFAILKQCTEFLGDEPRPFVVSQMPPTYSPVPHGSGERKKHPRDPDAHALRLTVPVAELDADTILRRWWWLRMVTLFIRHELEERKGPREPTRFAYRQIVQFLDNPPLAVIDTSRNIVAMGPPGTGKTTFLQILSVLYGLLGLYPLESIESDTDNKVILVSDLIATVLGETVQKTRAAFVSNMGRFLKVDEAYSILQSTRDNGSDDLYGRQAIDQIVSISESFGPLMAAAFIGYSGRLRRQLLSVNEGMVRRFPNTLTFREYTARETLDVFIGQLSNEYSPTDYRDIQSALELNASDRGEGGILLRFFEFLTGELYQQGESTEQKTLSDRFEYVDAADSPVILHRGLYVFRYSRTEESEENYRLRITEHRRVNNIGNMLSNFNASGAIAMVQGLKRKTRLRLQDWRPHHVIELLLERLVATGVCRVEDES